MTAPAQRPVWGADCPVSMPLPPSEPVLVEMAGFGMTQYRLAHSITGAEYEELRVPVYAPVQPPANTVVRGDAAIDTAGPPAGTP